MSGAEQNKILISEDLHKNIVKNYFNMTIEIIWGNFNMDMLSIG